MKNKISKSILLGIGALSGLSLMVGNVFASYIVSAATPISTRIQIAGVTKYTVTYYLPTSADSSTFASHSVELQEGANLYDELSSYATDVGSYSFATWHLNHGESYFKVGGANYAANLVASSKTIDDDITVYAKYVQTGVGYYNDGSDHYLTATSNNVTVNSDTFSYGKRIYSLSGVDEKTDIDLLTTSGIYNFTKAGNNWSASRNVKIKLGSWWNEWSPHTHIYLYNSSENTWISDIDTTDLNTKIEQSIDVKYTGMILVRTSNTTGSWNNLYGDGKGQTKDIEFNGVISGSNTYSATTNCVYIWDSDYVQDNKIKCHWDA